MVYLKKIIEDVQGGIKVFVFKEQLAVRDGREDCRTVRRQGLGWRAERPPQHGMVAGDRHNKARPIVGARPSAACCGAQVQASLEVGGLQALDGVDDPGPRGGHCMRKECRQTACSGRPRGWLGSTRKSPQAPTARAPAAWTPGKRTGRQVRVFQTLSAAGWRGLGACTKAYKRGCPIV